MRARRELQFEYIFAEKNKMSADIKVGRDARAFSEDSNIIVITF